jgi:glycosyltransferase involved in cell wall biosynthesis
MSREPRLTVGLPVYNGENFIAESIESLLGQTFEDFELVISDNASTDSTLDICRQYEKQDSRVRLVRQPRNIGLMPNHDFTFREARGELFKWAAHDDLYARDLLKLCVEALDKHPNVILAHSWTARIDARGDLTKTDTYRLDTASLRVPERFRSTLFDIGGDDDGAVIRTEVLRRIAPADSYHHADRTMISELALYGQFYQVPQWLYFRRDHPERAEEKYISVRSRCANLDPRRADRLRHPLVRLYGEYIWGYISAIRRAPLSAEERYQCYKHLAAFMVSRARVGHPWQELERAQRQSDDRAGISISALVAGREKFNAE